ncbi:MAG: hypothetical protein PHP08_00600 [Candidatus Dojkabacteria bacterium]|nr:hypothetical protein [Candidatus Dojkabacteria bacterium]
MSSDDEIKKQIEALYKKYDDYVKKDNKSPIEIYLIRKIGNFWYGFEDEKVRVQDDM